MSLTETKNTLNKNPNIGTLKLQNDHYIITVTYCGNYKADKEAKMLNPRYISVRCKCIDNSLIINNNACEIYLDFNKSFVANIYERKMLDKLVTQLNTSYDTIEELREIINSYFPTDCISDDLHGLNSPSALF